MKFSKAEKETVKHLQQYGKAVNTKKDEYDQKELAMGVEIELEHSPSKKVALEIAKDHLEEIPDYYTRLKKMEKEAETK